MKYQPKVTKPKKVGFLERLPTPKPKKPRFLLRWSPTGRLFDQKGNIVDSSEFESQSDCSNGDNACTSNIREPKIKRFPNSTYLLDRLFRFVYGTVCFRNDHVAAILGFGDLQWGNILITRVYFVEGLGHNLFSVGKFCDSDLEVAFRRNACFVRNLEGVALSKDEATDVIKTFLKRIIVLLQSPVIIIRTDNGTEFKNQVLKEYFDTIGISHQMSSVRTPQQNGVVERRNRTLVEAARTMLIFSRAPLFLWAEAIATACFTQNRSIIHRRFNKTPYELINGRKSDISFVHVFGALCYPKNDHEDIRKLGAKGDIGFFIGYSADSCTYRIYNRRTKKIIETMNVSFNELSAMAFEQRSLKLSLQSMTSRQISSGLDLTYAPSTITTQQPTEGELDLLFEAMYDDYIGGQPSATARTDFDELNSNDMVDGNTFVNPFSNPSTRAAKSSSSQNVDPSNMHTFYQPYPHEFQWTKDHPLEQNVKEAMIDHAWIDLMQEELLQFKRLDVWVLVPAPDNISPLTLKWLFKNKHDEAKPTKKHLKEVKRIFRYLRETINTGLWYSKDSGFELTEFSNANYAGCKDTFKSTSSGAQFLGEKLVSWSSKKQDCMALSTTKAEYVSLSACCAHVLWMRTQLTDYGFYFNKILIYCDSKSAIAISCNPVQHSRTKHIAVRYHFIKEHVEKGTIGLYFFKTDYQLADIFTKALPADRFNYLVRRLGMRSLSPKELERLVKS
nr:copia protein [Tanacetum cinerariifolium]